MSCSGKSFLIRGACSGLNKYQRTTVFLLVIIHEQMLAQLGIQGWRGGADTTASNFRRDKTRGARRLEGRERREYWQVNKLTAVRQRSGRICASRAVIVYIRLGLEEVFGLLHANSSHWRHIAGGCPLDLGVIDSYKSCRHSVVSKLCVDLNKNCCIRAFLGPRNWIIYRVYLLDRV